MRLKQLAIRHLSRREHSRAELEAKLKRAAASAPVNAEAVADVLDALAQSGLQSDERAAEALLRAKSGGMGGRRLAHLLRERGIAPALRQQSLQALEGSEYDRARSVWLKRFGGPAEEAAERARQARFLLGRGFDAEVVRRLVQRGIEDDSGPEPTP